MLILNQVIMKYCVYILFLAVIFSSSCASDHQIKVIVCNHSDIDRMNEIVELPLKELEKKIKIKDSLYTYLVKNSKGNVVPSQLTFDDKLIFQTSLKKGEKAQYTISQDTVREYQPLVFGRYYPERSGDFSWENDRVGFRFYGDSLKRIDGPSNALDLWLKRTDHLVLDKWYHDHLVNGKSYHTDHGEGCDPYAVGRTLGAGNIAPFIGDSLFLNENFEAYQILNEGPLRFTFKLTYPDMQVNNQTISESKIISLDAGSQLTRVVQSFGFSTIENVAIGIVKRKENDSIIVSVSNNTMIYAEPPMSDNNGQLFIGIIVPEGIFFDAVSTYDYVNPVNGNKGTFSNVLAVSKYNPDKEFIYYTGYGWSKYGFPDLFSFQSYMNQYREQLSKPLQIEIK